MKSDFATSTQELIDSRSVAVPGAYVMLMSDHGFGRFLKANVHLNTWLLDRGYLTMKGGNTVKERHWLGSRLCSLARVPGFRFVKKRVPRRMKAAGLQSTKVARGYIDWQRTKGPLLQCLCQHWVCAG